MKIAIDGYEANVINRVGIGTYAYQTLCHMYSYILNHRDNDKIRDIECNIYLPHAPLPDLPESTSWWKYHVCFPAKLWTFIALPISIWKNGEYDVVFSPTHYIPRFLRGRKVMSIMDVSYLKFPELFKPNDIYKLTYWTHHSVSHVNCIFTISEAAKRDIIESYHVSDTQVVVTYPGFNTNQTMTRMINSDIFTRYNLSKNYILSIGTLQPRKNYVRLIEAFSIFLTKNRQKFDNLELVIAGKKGWMYENILNAPETYGISDKVKFLDFIPDEDLPELYRHALCFVMPSLYEGFGLPVAEAISYKIPVVLSDVSSLPEIAGKAGIYIDPNNVESIANGMLKAVRERNLIQGKNRILQGTKHIKQFSWELAAEKTLRTLMEVAQS